MHSTSCSHNHKHRASDSYQSEPLQLAVPQNHPVWRSSWQTRDARLGGLLKAEEKEADFEVAKGIIISTQLTLDAGRWTRGCVDEKIVSCSTKGRGRPTLVTVASFRRRQLLAEEVPGLYIRRLTLEDPKGARDRSQSSSARHVCYPRRRPSPPLIGPRRKSSSYRSVTQWLNCGMKEDAPAFLTVTSLQLPDSPIPLIDSQAIARSCGSRESPVGISDDKDAIMDELLRKVVAVRGQSEGHRSRRNKETASKCTRDEFADLEECTRRIIEGPGYTRRRSRRPALAITGDCICSEVSENLRINIRKKTEVRRSSRSPSPEVTHVIRIAMRYHGHPEESGAGKPPEEPVAEKRVQDREDTETEKRCSGVSVALDFTLNCSSLQLTSREVSVKPIKTKGSLTRLDQSV